MRNYNIISPSIGGMLSDDFLYFEGVNRPSEIFLIKDEEVISNENIEILERYFNDIYNLFLRKISVFVSLDNINDEESIKLQALLQEMIRIKKMMINSSELK